MKKLVIITLIVCVVLIAALVIYIISGYDNTLTLKEYKFKSDKVSKLIKIAFVSDLHGSTYGEGNSELIEMINSCEPDIVLLGGDMFDIPERLEVSRDFIGKISELYPVYAVMGNHEYGVEGYTPEQMRSLYRELGVVLIENDCLRVDIKGENINLCGADVMTGEVDWSDKTVEGVDTDNYTLLINHRPDLWTEFTHKDVDLMLSGHAHGGQWVVPGIFNGILAPNQGFFPKYAGGLYEFEDGMNLVVSRGLSLATSIPRVYNPPELVIIKIESDR